MDSWLVMAYSYSSSHNVRVNKSGRATHGRYAQSGPAARVARALARYPHINAPSSAVSMTTAVPTSSVASDGADDATGRDKTTTTSAPVSAVIPDTTIVVSISIDGEARTYDTAEDAADLVARIKATPGLTHLKLKGNTLSKAAYEQVVKALVEAANANGSALKVIDSSDCFTRRGPADIHSAMRALGQVIERKTLTELNLGDNALSLEGAKILSPQLARCTSLTVLRLDNTGLGPLGGKLIGLGLTEGARRGLRLKVLRLGRSRQENKGAASLAAALTAMQSLEELCLPQNGIKAAGIAALADAVQANPQLRVLDLNDNTFRPAGCRAMALALASTHGLEDVNFGDCLLKPAGSNSILKALADNHPNLKKIDLTYNEMNADNVDAICALATTATSLAHLDINGNILSDADVDRVKDAIGSDTADDVLGPTDEMEEPEEDDESEGEEGAGGDDDDQDAESESENESDEEEESEEDEAALVAEVEMELKA
eukprot:m.205467 g.205467  ORF g.205467 m.205467 type:complete len:489 (+) comp22951_c0_seq1:74-1540(+)